MIVRAPPIVLSCMIRPPERGASLVAFTHRAADILLRYYQTAGYLSREAPTASSPVCTAASCTIQTRGLGASPATSIQTASSSPRRNSQTALSWRPQVKAIGVLAAVGAGRTPPQTAAVEHETT